MKLALPVLFLRRSLRATLFLPCSGLACLAACSDGAKTAPTTTGETTKLSEQYVRLGGNLGKTIAQLKSSATSSGTTTPADLARVGKVAASATGGTDVGEAQKGMSGDKEADIDGLDGNENVTTFVPDPPSGGVGTTVTPPTFAAWNKGDLCHLAWTKGASWVVTSKCGDTSGAWVCRVSSDEAVCNACSAGGGECQPCDMDQTSFTCSW